LRGRLRSRRSYTRHRFIGRAPLGAVIKERTSLCGHSVIAEDIRDSSKAAAALAGRSRQVRKILRLEARAGRLLVRYEASLAAATRTMQQARDLLDDAHGIEASLTSTQRRELRCGREAAGAAPAARPASSSPQLTMRSVSMHERRSQKVRTILQLQGRAATLQAR
jgi:hypothetical protein